jgi:pyridoxal phosphate enzyme (YggS family)
VSASAPPNGAEIATRLAQVRARIDAAARASGRDPEDVGLVAVSKTHPPEAIRAAYAAGQRAFGENYAQELEAKAASLADLSEIEWHFIGHLQTNKARLVAPVACMVHAIDSSHVAKELARRAARAGRTSIAVLVEVNVSGEAQKSGVAPQDLEELLASVEAEPALALRGLMTMPPFGDLAAARSVFGALSSIRNLHGGAARLPELSMGMSDDLEIAVAAGATRVRVGTAIFGERDAR